MSEIRISVYEAWQEAGPQGLPVFHSAPLTILTIDDAGSVDRNRQAAALAVKGATGRAATLSFTTARSISATVRRADPVPAASAQKS